jgi:hypothetical protein
MTRRRRWTIIAVAVAVVAFVALGWLIVPGLIHRQVSGLGATDIHEAASLPARISVCGRVWKKDELDRRFSRSEVLATFGAEPSLVDPLPFAPCPKGPCTNIAQNAPCDTVVFVRVGEDAYLDYALSGGP